MFYKQEILTDRKHGMGIIWLAATLGPRGTIKKLQKRELLGVDVPKACSAISTPQDPLALRTSSSLMVGVARVLSHQCGYLYADVNNFHSTMRRQIFAKDGGFQAAIDLPITERTGRSEALLLQDDPCFSPELTLPFLSQELLLDDLDESYLSAYIDKTGESTISLPGLEDVSARLHVDLDSPGLGKLPDDDLLDEQLEVNDLIDFDFDINGDIVPRRPPSPAQSQLDSPSRKRSSQLMHSDLSFQADSALKRAKTTPTPLPHTFPQKGLFDGLEFELGGIQESEQQLAELDFVPDVEPVVPDIARSRQANRRKPLSLDEAIEIPNAELLAWRDNYIQTMQESKTKRASKKAKKNADVVADLLVWHIPGLAPYPIGNLAHLKLGTTPEKDSQAVRIPEQFSPPAPELPMADIQDRDVELARNAGVEAENLSFSHSIMPWNQSREGSVTVNRTVESRAKSASILGTPRKFSFIGTPMQKQNSRLTTPVAQLRLIESPVGSVLNGLDGFGHQTTILEDEDDQAAPHPDEVTFMTQNDTQLALDNLQAETQNFLGFMVDRVHEKDSRHQPNAVAGSITFDELCEPAKTNRFVATQAFTHVLQLATMGMVKVQQESAYADITLKPLVDRES